MQPLRPNVPTFLPSDLRVDRLAGVLDHGDIALLRDRHDLLDIDRPARQMHGQDRLRMLGDGRLDQIGVDGAGVGIDVHEDGQGVEIGDRVDGCDERIRRRDDLVARADAEHAQRRAQGRRAAVGQVAVGHAHRLGEHLLEIVHRMAAQAAPVAALERLEQGLFVLLVDDGPGLREGLAADRRAALEGQRVWICCTAAAYSDLAPAAESRCRPGRPRSLFTNERRVSEDFMVEFLQWGLSPWHVVAAGMIRSCACALTLNIDCLTWCYCRDPRDGGQEFADDGLAVSESHPCTCAGVLL